MVRKPLVVGAAAIGLGALAGALFCELKQSQPEVKQTAYQSVQHETTYPTATAITLPETPTQTAYQSDEEILKKLLDFDTPREDRESLMEGLSPQGKKEFQRRAKLGLDAALSELERLSDEINNPEKYWTVPRSVPHELRESWQRLRDGDYANAEAIVKIVKLLDEQRNAEDKKILYDDIRAYRPNEESIEGRKEKQEHLSTHDRLLVELTKVETDNSYKSTVAELLQSRVLSAIESDAPNGTDLARQWWTEYSISNHDGAPILDASSEAYQQLALLRVGQLDKLVAGNNFESIATEEREHNSFSIALARERYETQLSEGDLAGVQSSEKFLRYLEQRNAQIGTPEWQQSIREQMRDEIRELGETLRK